MITPWSHCRICHAELEPILRLGTFSLSTFLAPDDPEPPRAPLQFAICTGCNLVQLEHSVAPDQMFRKYWYLSGINEVMRAELQDVADQAQAVLGRRLNASDTVIDIGANDGTLLSKIGVGPRRIAFEPAYNLFKLLRPHAEMLISDYFPAGLSEVGADATLITSIAMFYDLDDPARFVQAIKQTLRSDGLWIVQFQDLLQMLHATAVDNICHEHVTYPSVTDLVRLCAMYGLEVVDAERRAINGGSVRLYIRHEGQQAISPRVGQLLWAERHLYEDLQQFSWRVTQMKRQLVTTLAEAARQGAVDCYGASTKFSTLAQYCGLTPDLIRCCVERSPEKWGRTTVTGIPIVSEADWRADAAPTTMIAIWQFKDAVISREASYLAAGGRFIVPLPYTEVISEARRA